MSLRPRTRLAALALASLGLTAAVVACPALWAGESVALHDVVNTAIALTELFIALVVIGRVRADPHLEWVGFLAGLIVLAGGSLPFVVIPSALGDGSYFGVWAPLVATLAGAALIAASSMVRDRPLPRTKPWVALAFTYSLALLAAIAAAVDLLRPLLENAISPQVVVHHAQLLAGPVPLVVARFGNAILWTVAAVGFARRAERNSDSFAAWIAAGSVLEVSPRLFNLVVPSSYPHWLLVADAFRLGGYLLLAAGAVRELSGYWHRLADAAVQDERRRIARDMHDGLAQELAFIAAESDGELALAAQRALDESRRAIAALSRRVDEPVAVAIAQAVEDVAQRWGARLRLVVEETPDVDPDAREQLVRIAREAVTNSARHAGTGDVRVEVGGGRSFRLRISDDGRGFDTDGTQRGHGLVSMRERARALGATFAVRSDVGGGTEVEVTLA